MQKQHADSRCRGHRPGIRRTWQFPENPALPSFNFHVLCRRYKQCPTSCTSWPSQVQGQEKRETVNSVNVMIIMMIITMSHVAWIGRPVYASVHIQHLAGKTARQDHVAMPRTRKNCCCINTMTPATIFGTCRAHQKVFASFQCGDI